QNFDATRPHAKGVAKIARDQLCFVIHLPIIEKLQVAAIDLDRQWGTPSV
ncbi:MAG: hypothetical protein JWO45_733, partial [Spartobacteria bacterium]|nr:hypothetical protein [Spartobacteria bacterium]